MTSLVANLGYLICEQPDPSGWGRFAEYVLGAKVRELDGDLCLRLDENVARIVVTRADRSLRSGHDANVTYGWICRSEADWMNLRVKCEAVGLKLTAREATAWRTEAFRCSDPDGFAVEVAYGLKTDPADQFVSPRGVEFVTGDQGLGHVMVSTTSCEAMMKFYVDLLGFQVRETRRSTHSGQLIWAFLSPCPREHSLAVMATKPTRRLRHLLIEVASVDMVGRAFDRCLDVGAELRTSIGRHWNDGMLSFYVKGPGGFDIEYGTGGIRVDDQAEWLERSQGGSGAVSIWGHRALRNTDSFGDPIGTKVADPG